MIRDVTRVFEQADDNDPASKPGLMCHVEIDNTRGSTSQEIDKSTAGALRTLAAQIEAGELESGHHPIKDASGEKIGEVYLDYYAIG